MLGDGRRKTLETLREKPTLQPLENLQSVSDIQNAVREVSVDEYMSPETGIIDQIERIHVDLPEAAKVAYVEDETLLRRINALRRQFETWKGRAIRDKEMPSPAEADPSNYPTNKLQKRMESERKAHEELDERKQKVKAGVRGARRRALESIGSSVGKQNAKKRKSDREMLREKIEAGDHVLFTDLPDPDKKLGEVIRVNQKSVRVAYANNPEKKRTVDLKSKYITKIPPDEVEKAKRKMSETNGRNTTSPT